MHSTYFILIGFKNLLKKHFSLHFVDAYGIHRPSLSFIRTFNNWYNGKIKFCSESSHVFARSGLPISLDLLGHYMF